MPHLRVNITRQCNLNCKYCYIDRKEEHLELEVLRFNVEKHKPAKVSISGGEPFLHPKFVEIMQFLLNNRCDINVVTNGSYISKSKDILRLIYNDSKENNRKVTFSLSYDGWTKMALKQLELIKDIGFNMKVYLFPSKDVCENFTNILKNISEFEAMAQLLFPVPLGDNVGTKIDFKTWEDIVLRYLEAVHKTNVCGFYQPSWDKLSSMGKLASSQDDSLAIDCDGRLYECCLLSALKPTIRFNIDSKCKCKEGEGCLALKLEHGKDYRLMEQTKTLCPVLLNEVI